MAKKYTNLHFENILEKKSLSIQNENLLTIFSCLLFVIFFWWSLSSSIPLNKEIFNNVTLSKNTSNNQKNLINPDIALHYLLNYKINQNIMVNQPRFTDYLKNPAQPLHFNHFYNKGFKFQLDSNNLINGLELIKSELINEDLHISPFIGKFLIESEIISTMQSENFYMVEVVKTFTQGKKVVKVLEKKAFQLKSLESGEFQYLANILFTSTQINK